MLMTAISFSFANTTDGINGNVTTSFKKDFVNAKEVKWENGKVFVKATFKWNEQVTYAYYSKDGELIAITRNILTSQLPINHLINLHKNYTAYWITDLFEINANNETSYYLTVENADYKMVLKADNTGDWDVYSKTEKVNL